MDAIKEKEYVDLIMSLDPAETEAMYVFYKAIKSGKPEEEARELGLAAFRKATAKDTAHLH